MKVLITGGHFSPAYALIQELKKENRVVIVGRRHAQEGHSSDSLEYQLAEKLDVPFINLKAGRLGRKITRNSIASFLRAPQGFGRAMSILKKEKPDVVLSFGGYISLPVCLAARLLSIPIVIHEQTQRAGLANKYIGKIANKVCISFDSSRPFFPASKTVLTGLPLRPEVTQVIKKFDIPSNKPLLYITGGSTGSHAINELIYQTIDQILDSYSVIHQTGDSEFKDSEKLEELKGTLSAEKQKKYIVQKYVYPDEIGWVLKNTEIIVGRAGINTVNEILTLHKKAVLIPLPHGQKGEQKSNAELVEKSGLGYYIDQDLATPEVFIELIHKAEKLKAKEGNLEDIMKPTEKIIEVIESVVK